MVCEVYRLYSDDAKSRTLLHGVSGKPLCGTAAPVIVARQTVDSSFWGPSVREGIAGFGPTIEAALRNFDAQYLRALRPPQVRTKNQKNLYRVSLSARVTQSGQAVESSKRSISRRSRHNMKRGKEYGCRVRK
jgi:hypothetical protein